MKMFQFPYFLSAAILAPLASASDFNWSGTAGNIFGLGANWVGGLAPANSLTTDTAVFGPTLATNKPNLNEASRSIAGLNFQTSGWTLDSSAAANTLSLGAGGITISGGGGTINNPAVTTIGSATAGNNFNLALGAGNSWSVSTGNNLELYAVLQGSENMTLTGGGEVGLRGVNSSYSGNLAVSDGTLRVRNTSSLGDLIGSTTVSGTGTLRFSASGAYNENLILSGAGNAGGNPAPANGFTSQGAIYYNVASATTLGGSITLNGATTINNSNSGTLSLNGAISGSGSLTLIDSDPAAVGQISLGGNNTYTGATLIDDVRIQIQNTHALSSSSGVTLTDKDGSRLLVNFFSISVKSLSGGGLNGGGINLSTGSLSIGSGNTDCTYAGIISSTGNIEKVGTAKLTLTGANTYVGDTKVNGGTLSITQAYLSDSSDVRIAGGKLSLDFSGSDTVRSLYINNVLMRAGTWGASGTGAEHVNDSFFAGAGTINVTTGASLDAYAAWTDSFVLAGTDADAETDYDDDGFPNLLEWILGGDPTSSDSNEIGLNVTQNTTHLTLVFDRTDDSESLVTLEVQRGANLVDWIGYPVGASSTGPDVNGIFVTVVENDTAADTVTVSIPLSLAENGKIFARLRATKN